MCRIVEKDPLVRDGYLQSGINQREEGIVLLFGCLLATAAAFAPRLVLLFAWVFGNQVNAVFDTWIMPLLCLIFLAYATIMYVLVWNPLSGISGWDWLWIALGVMLDIMKWGQIANVCRGIPGYPEEAY